MADSVIDELLSKIEPEIYLNREGIEYKPTFGSSGPQLNVKECPACGDGRWKVYLNAESGLGNCFVCDKKYRMFTFIQQHTGLYGVQLINHMKQVALEVGWAPRNLSRVKVNWSASPIMLPESNPIPIMGRNLKYLDARNIDIETARYFRLRYCHQGYYEYMGTFGKVRQSYDGRVIVPIFDRSGSLVSFQGRDITGKAERKYLFPPGHAATGRYLYNAQNISGFEEVVVGEGVFDVMAIKVAMDGDSDLRHIGAVGTFGKHMSHGGKDDQLGEFIKLKRSGLKKVTFMWDGSPDAIVAAVDAALLLKQTGVLVKVAILPEGKDPNEVTADEVRRAYWKAQVCSNQLAVRLKLKHAV